MTCSCGHVMPVEAKTRKGAISALKKMMTKKAIAAHMQEKHAGQALMTVAEVHAGIEKNLVAV